MIRFTYLKIALILIFLFLNINHLNALDELDYANHLYEIQDYFRAISTFKRISFFSNDRNLQMECQLKIASSYYLSRKFKSAILTLAHFENAYTLNDSISSEVSFRYGNIYYQMRLLPMALANWNDMNIKYHPKKPFYQILYYAETDQYKDCYNILQSINQRTEECKNLKAQFKIGLHQLENRKQKNKLLAISLSTVIPGAGQIYSNHYYDGILAFLYVSSAAYLSYLGYLYENQNDKGYYRTTIAVSFTSILHFANVLGAAKTSSYRNKKMKEENLTILRKLLNL